MQCHKKTNNNAELVDLIQSLDGPITKAMHDSYDPEIA